jgi:hypothetical protein
MLMPGKRFHHDPVGYLQRGIVRGGAAGVAGDFVFGEFSRHGQRLSDYLVGPTFGGTGQDLLAIFTRGVWGSEDPTKDLIFLARNNLPLQNVWYAKWALDTAIWSNLLEWAQPGYASRTRRRARRQGIKPWTERFQ